MSDHGVCDWIVRGAEAICDVVQAVSAAATRQAGLARPDSIQPPHVGKHY